MIVDWSCLFVINYEMTSGWCRVKGVSFNTSSDPGPRPRQTADQLSGSSVCISHLCLFYYFASWVRNWKWSGRIERRVTEWGMRPGNRSGGRYIRRRGNKETVCRIIMRCCLIFSKYVIYVMMNDLRSMNLSQHHRWIILITSISLLIKNLFE